MLINTEKTKKELEEFINCKILHKQPIFIYFRYILSNRTLNIKKENILKINPNLVDVNSKEWIDAYNNYLEAVKKDVNKQIWKLTNGK